MQKQNTKKLKKTEKRLKKKTAKVRHLSVEITRLESENFQFKDIRRGGRAFVFQAQLNDPHMSSEFVVKNIRPSIF